MNLEDLPGLVERSFRAVAEVEVWAEGELFGGGSAFLATLDDARSNQSSIVITNAHVVNGGGKVEDPEIRVFFQDGYEAEGQVVGIHPMVDIAIFRLAESRQGALHLRANGEIHLGEFVIALGHPSGLSWTATSGLVSGLDRPESHLYSGLPITLLQTDADINPGNSGGPLIGLDGRVVGVNTQGVVNAELVSRLNFAIPAHSAGLAADAILSAEGEEHVPRPWTGVKIRNRPWKAPQEVIYEFGIKGGAVVNREPPSGSPGNAAGLREGDVVVGIGDLVIDDPGDFFTWMLDPACLERPFEVRVLRDGAIETTTVRAVDRALEDQ
jgi:S1-C subfamily serine protease